MTRLHLQRRAFSLLVGAVFTGGVGCSGAGTASGTDTDDAMWKITTRGAHVWLESYRADKLSFEYRIGSAGVISALNDRLDGVSFLAPSFRGEITDRVIQWTLWSNGIKNPVAGLPASAQRYNVSQAGTRDNRGAAAVVGNTLAPTLSVSIDRSANTVDIYSVPQDQWESSEQAAIKNKVSSLTRYTLLPGGALSIKQFNYVDTVTLNGTEVPFDDLYMEVWLPLASSRETFTGLALSLNADGTPRQAYSNHSAGHSNIPSYPHFPAQRTSGYAVAFNIDAPQRTALAVVYGVQGTASSNPRDGLELNLRDYQNVMAILPGARLWQVPAGSVVCKEFVLLPAPHGLTKELVDQLDRQVAALSRPVVYRPGEAMPPDVVAIAQTLSRNLAQRGSRTDALGDLVVNKGR
jgi:hypothetical protein